MPASATERVLWVLAGVVALQRLAELGLARRNESWARSRGAIEHGAGHYPAFFVLHVGWLVGWVVEAWLRGPVLSGLWPVWLVGFVAAEGLRYWAIASLGENWTTRIVVVPGERVKRSGPYRFLRHPNYLVMVMEFILTPLLLRAPVTLVVFSLCNMWVLRLRVRLEEKALRELTDYEEKFPGTRRTVND